MAKRIKFDLMANVPDDVLIEVFGHLRSLRDKLRVESVSRRFQRCLIELLNTTPISLELGECYRAIYSLHNPPTTFDFKINGYYVPRYQLPSVVQTLAEKVKFTKIMIDVTIPWRETCPQLLDSILAVLVNSDNDCLQKVTMVEIHHHDRWSQALLRRAFAKCAKLSALHLDLFPYGNQLQQMIQLFQSIPAHKLKHLYLEGFRMPMDVLVTELRGSAWAVLEEIKLQISEENLDNPRIDTLFTSLSGLPALRKCHFELNVLYLNYQQWVAGLNSLFTNHSQIAVLVDYFVYLDEIPETGCHMVTRIRQIQAVHPELVVGFGCSGNNNLTLTLGAVSFEQRWIIEGGGPEPDPWIAICDNPQCIECGIFYPTFIVFLRLCAYGQVDALRRGEQQDVHLPRGRLDRCRIATVVAQLNRDLRATATKWVAEHAVMNEDRNLATITFNLGQFQITVDCGRCLSYGCVQCV